MMETTSAEDVRANGAIPNINMLTMIFTRNRGLRVFQKCLLALLVHSEQQAALLADCSATLSLCSSSVKWDLTSGFLPVRVSLRNRNPPDAQFLVRSLTLYLSIHLQAKLTSPNKNPSKHGRINWNWQKKDTLKTANLLAGCDRIVPAIDPYQETNFKLYFSVNIDNYTSYWSSANSRHASYHCKSHCSVACVRQLQWSI